MDQSLVGVKVYSWISVPVCSLGKFEEHLLRARCYLRAGDAAE